MDRHELKGVDGTMPDALTEGVNINVSTLEELSTIDLIGSGRARKIIDYRDEHGSFGNWDELKAVGFSDDEIGILKDTGVVLEGVPEEER